MIQMHGSGLIAISVNGEKREVVAKPSDTLLTVLRDKLGLTGAKPGCENGDCGACTVLIDGWPIKSCLTLAVECIGHDIMTIEGIKDSPAQRAFIEQWGFQCGYCTSGFLLVCHALSTIHPEATDEVLMDWLQSNICRCTSYEEIERAIRSIVHSKNEIEEQVNY